MIIYDNGEVRVEVSVYSARIMALGSKPLYLTLPELAGIGKAIVDHLSAAEEGPIGGYVDECEKRAEWAKNDPSAPF